MVGYDPRPGYPPDRTVRGDRRSRDPFRPTPPWPAGTAVRRGAGVPGDGAGHARRPVGASLAAPGLTLVGDKGFARAEFEDLVTTGCGMSMVRPDRRDEAPRYGSIGWIRQWIESVNDTLKASSISNVTAAGPPPACTP